MHPFPSVRLLALRAFVTLAAITAPLARAQDTTPAVGDFFFHDGDTPVVFLGDSITQQKMYTTLVETYLLTRFPNWKITFRNAGWSGDTSWLSQRGDFDAALQRDVLDLKPKSVLIDFGMNDARGGDGTYSRYLASSTNLVKTLVKAGVRVAMVTSSPEEKYEPNAPAGSSYNVMLKKYCVGLNQVTDNEQVPFVDQYTPFVALIEAGRKAGLLSATAAPGDPNIVRLIPDGVHPNWGGHLIMATAILEGLHVPGMFSTMSVDASTHSITSSQGCTVEWKDSPGDTVQFKRTDLALPWPIPSDPTIDVVLKIPGLDAGTTLNNYGLTVTGLKIGFYKLSIDGEDVATYSSTDLANGVNLGFVHQGPIYEQCQQLLQAVEQKNDAYFERWRNVQLFTGPDWLKNTTGMELARKSEMDRLDGVIAKDEQAIDSFRQPVPHVFKLELTK